MKNRKNITFLIFYLFSSVFSLFSMKQEDLDIPDISIIGEEKEENLPMPDFITLELLLLDQVRNQFREFKSKMRNVSNHEKTMLDFTEQIDPGSLESHLVVNDLFEQWHYYPNEFSYYYAYFFNFLLQKAFKKGVFDDKVESISNDILYSLYIVNHLNRPRGQSPDINTKTKLAAFKIVEQQQERIKKIQKDLDFSSILSFSSRNNKQNIHPFITYFVQKIDTNKNKRNIADFLFQYELDFLRRNKKFDLSSNEVEKILKHAIAEDKTDTTLFSQMLLPYLPYFTESKPTQKTIIKTIVHDTRYKDLKSEFFTYASQNDDFVLSIMNLLYKLNTDQIDNYKDEVAKLRQILLKSNIILDLREKVYKLFKSIAENDKIFDFHRLMNTAYDYIYGPEHNHEKLKPQLKIQEGSELWELLLYLRFFDPIFLNISILLLSNRKIRKSEKIINA